MALLPPPNYFAGSALDRVAWLRASSDTLNRALASAHARFMLLDCGNPVMHGAERGARVALFAWADVADAVWAGVRAVGGRGVFGADAYGLRKRADAPEKLWRRATDGLVADIGLVFLGVAAGAEEAIDASAPPGKPLFALSLATPHAARLREQILSGPFEAPDLRGAMISGALGAADAPLVAHARALLDWHARHVFCPACAARQYPVWGGHKRACGSSLAALADAPAPAFVTALAAAARVCRSSTSLQNYVYPRTDPVVILAVVSADTEHILLTRQRGWPAGLYSCIAGFVEPGESLEEAVAREAYEEAGIHVRRVTYHSSQPWPFPSSLMLGAYAAAADTALRLDLDGELEDAFFAPRADVLELLAGGAVHRGGTRLIVPGPFAIAHALLAGWAHRTAQLPRL